MESGREHRAEQLPFSQKLLNEYPELNTLVTAKDDKSKSDISTISSIYVNGETVDYYIQLVIDGQKSGDIEYHLNIIETSLNKLAEQNVQLFENFVVQETNKLSQRKEQAAKAIGNKKRTGDGTYK